MLLTGSSSTIEGNGLLPNLIARSPAMQKVCQRLQYAARSNAPVLLTGEPGVGKKKIAKTIHRLSERKNASFVHIHCAAYAQRCLSERLFGDCQGTSGEISDKATGQFHAADGGTIFLEEIDRTSAIVQAKWMEMFPSGASECDDHGLMLHPDVRVISTSCEDLEMRVEKKRFRQDLYWRLRVIPIEIPPLRERREDIGSLLTWFLKRFNKANQCSVTQVSQEALAAIQDYHWPGNLREFQCCLERAVIVAETDELTLDLLPDSITGSSSSSTDTIPVSDIETLTQAVVRQGMSLAEGTTNLHSQVVDRIEKELIAQVLNDCGGVQTKAATLLGINRNTLHKKIKEYQLDQVSAAADSHR